ncbi:cupin domain-containing protein [Rhodoplanes sp. TEM]|uniref:Cupin domain-containing protein n=1 Tax=Rhodoplanes tepidamans TaxID=200616 RepID=A0ABT5J9Y6_RHOTP|nr:MULTISPECIES: cupin domain-containing protein [Rhodoplanes]MDC7786401.1 cupin domain-containing protein [Rhodoplanes tepidamans]MDC7983612.1 cupin domain-containing protein [Rhodoplanes sp. TEM]MDQ0354146.1 cupin 2 domain-containing protein [Rhodoplanes tepidamans]
MITSGNLFAGAQARRAEELIATLLATPDLKIERIVSHGQASPPGFWYDQAWAEWVVLLTGSATLRFEAEPTPRALAPGDYVHIPAHVRHRVEATDPEHPTVWLAVHHR